MIARILRFLKTPVGAAVLFLLAMFTVFYFIREHRERRAMAEAPEGINVLGQMSPEENRVDPGDPITSEWVAEGKLEKIRIPRDNTPRDLPTPAPTQPKTAPKAVPKLIHVYQAAKPESVEPESIKPPTVFAPPGTLIPCQLVITVDSSALETPVVGFVTEDIWHNQQRIIPAGTEVHASAKRGRIRDRIEVTGEWKFVRHDGREVRLNGIALHRDYNPDTDSYAITDGSAGIRGEILKTDEFLEFKLFAASALGAASQSAKKTTKSVFGEYDNNSLGNAALDGGEAVMDRYAKLLLDQVEGDGLFVRVAAGTEFYVYTQQAYEPKLASLAGLKQGQRPRNSWEIGQSPNEGLAETSASSAPSPRVQQTLAEREQLESYLRNRRNQPQKPHEN